MIPATSNRRRFRFSLRTLLIVVTVVAIGIRWMTPTKFDASIAVVLFIGVASAGGTLLVFVMAPRR